MIVMTVIRHVSPTKRVVPLHVTDDSHDGHDRTPVVVLRRETADCWTDHARRVASRERQPLLTFAAVLRV